MSPPAQQQQRRQQQQQQQQQQSSSPRIVRFTVDFRSTGRRAVGYRVPAGTPIQAVYKELLRSGGASCSNLSAPAVFIGSGEARGEPDHLLGDRFWGRWGTNKAWALESFRAKMTECFHGITRALATEGGWFVAAGGAEVLTAELFSWGLAEASLREPGVVESAVSVFSYNCPSRIQEGLHPSGCVETVETVQEGGVVIFPSREKVDGHDAVVEVNPYASHCIFFEEVEYRAEAPSMSTRIALQEYLRATMIPRAFLNTAGNADDIMTNFQQTAEAARQGALVVNLFNSHINANFLAGLLHETCASQNSRVPKREREHLRKLNEEEDNMTERGPFQRKEIKVSETDMTRMEKRFSTTYLGDSILLKNAEQLVKLSATGEQKVSLEYELPDDVPLKNFITIDVRACCSTDVAVELSHRLRAMARCVENEELGHDGGEARTLCQCWQLHDSMTKAADQAEAAAFRLQVVSLAFATLGLSCMVFLARHLRHEQRFVDAAHPERAQWFSWHAMFVPFVLVASQVYHPLMRWRSCVQAAGITKSYIYRFRTRTGDFKIKTALPGRVVRTLSSGKKPASPRVVLADAISHLQRELASESFGSQCRTASGGRVEKWEPETAAVAGVAAPSATPACEDDPEQPLLLTNAPGSYGAEAFTFRRPSTNIDDPADDGIEDMDSDDYVSWRVQPLQGQLMRLSERLAIDLGHYRTCVMLSLVGAVVMGGLRLIAWMPAALVVAGAVQTWVHFQCIPDRLSNCRRAVEVLDEVLHWYGSLDSVQRCTPGTLERLVDVAEAASMAEAAAITASLQRWHSHRVSTNPGISDQK